MISDIGRSERGKQDDLKAGARVLALARELRLPVFFYSSERAIHAEGQQLMDAGAVVVTSSYVELVRAIRLKARESFDQFVRRALHELPGAEAREQVDDIDYLVTLHDGSKLAVETPHWLRIADPKRGESVKARYAKLSKAINDGMVDRALLVTQKELLGSEQWLPAPPGVEPVVADQLPERLAALAARPEG